MMRQVSSPVRRGAGRKGQQWTSLAAYPASTIYGDSFLWSFLAFLGLQRWHWTPKFRHFGVDQQYPPVSSTGGIRLS